MILLHCLPRIYQEADDNHHLPMVNHVNSSIRMTATNLKIHTGLRISEIDAQDWNRLVAGESPFVQHAFLLALERSGSVGEGTGWEPYHLAVFEHDQLVAAMPLYIKHHSYGEYVFDWGWADAYRRHGLHYYPKLLTAIPFTPSQSPRLLVQDSQTAARVMPLVFDTVTTLARERGLSSWHILFPDAASSLTFESTKLIRREAVQFHWHNRQYQRFDDFLADCSSRKRKNLKKERQDVAAQGFCFERLSGAQITAEVWDRFYQFYQNTYQVRGQYGYLTREFFTLLHCAMPDQVFLIMVSHPERIDYVAGALFLRDQTTLYGRYWGCEQDYQNLHFETCYYQGIEFCIAEGLQRFDAGAQGEHKLRRGFVPITTCSYHWIAEPAFERAIRDFCEEERAYTSAYLQEAASQLPFKSNAQGLSIINEDS